MAHYALINKDNIVVQVITGVDENITQIDTDGTEIGGSSEAWEQFYASRPWFEGLTCKRTSYNNNIRKHFAAVGFTYDAHFDAFIAPQPYPSWKLNYTTFVWEAPITRPDKVEGGVPLEGYAWRWFEYNQEWVKVKLPTK
jgi:hypothetical protein